MVKDNKNREFIRPVIDDIHDFVSFIMNLYFIYRKLCMQKRIQKLNFKKHSLTVYNLGYVS